MILNKGLKFLRNFQKSYLSIFDEKYEEKTRGDVWFVFDKNYPLLTWPEIGFLCVLVVVGLFCILTGDFLIFLFIYLFFHYLSFCVHRVNLRGDAFLITLSALFFSPFFKLEQKPALLFKFIFIESYLWLKKYIFMQLVENSEVEKDLFIKTIHFFPLPFLSKCFLSVH